MSPRPMSASKTFATNASVSHMIAASPSLEIVDLSLTKVAGSSRPVSDRQT